MYKRQIYNIYIYNIYIYNIYIYISHYFFFVYFRVHYYYIQKVLSNLYRMLDVEYNKLKILPSWMYRNEKLFSLSTYGNDFSLADNMCTSIPQLKREDFQVPSMMQTVAKFIITERYIPTSLRYNFTFYMIYLTTEKTTTPSNHLVTLKDSVTIWWVIIHTKVFAKKENT